MDGGRNGEGRKADVCKTDLEITEEGIEGVGKCANHGEVLEEGGGSAAYGRLCGVRTGAFVVVGG